MTTPPPSNLKFIALIEVEVCFSFSFICTYDIKILGILKILKTDSSPSVVSAGIHLHIHFVIPRVIPKYARNTHWEIQIHCFRPDASMRLSWFLYASPLKCISTYQDSLLFMNHLYFLFRGRVICAVGKKCNPWPYRSSEGVLKGAYEWRGSYPSELVTRKALQNKLYQCW